jgi:rhamnose transport system permease protein
LANFTEIALMALPLSLIVITNEIDLSVASILGLSSSLLGALWQYKLAMPWVGPGQANQEGFENYRYPKKH